MKRYILVALALIGFAGNAVAQRDITSQYITNATLSEGMNNGWTVSYTGSGNYSHFNNVAQGNNTVGYATEAYAGWNELAYTAYSMTQTITLPTGNYRLVNYSFFRQGPNYDTDSNKSLAYLKAGEQKVAIKTLGSIPAAGYANSQAEGANCFDSKMYRNFVEFTSDGSPIEIGVYGTFDAAYSWCIVGMFELFDLDDVASVSSPTDVTYAITNPGFEYRNLTGWTNEGFAYVGNNDNIGGKAGLAYVEYYRGGGLENNKYISQTLTGLTNGLYEVIVYGHQKQGTPNNGVKLYANNDYTFIGSTTQDYSVRTTVSDNKLTIKIQTEGSTANWTAFDKFRLKFYGDPLQAYKDLLAGKVAEAQALVNGGTLRTGAANQLQTIINDNDNDDDAFTTEAQFNTAVSNIEAGITQANAIAATYDGYDAYRAQFETLKNGVAASQNLTTFENAITAANTAVANATSADVAETQKAAVRAAAMTFIQNTDDHQFDITFLASQNYWDWKKKDGSNAGIVQDQFLTNRPASIPSFAESYETTCETTGTVLYQTVSGLPEGYYQVGMYAAAMFTDGRGFTTDAKEGDADRTFAFAGNLNDASSILRTGAPISFNTVRDFNDLTTLDVNVHLSTVGDLTFGVQKDANGSNWHFAQIMSIVYSNAPDLTQLKATRDALVAEATGLKNGADAVYLTDAQKSALQAAINEGAAADDFDELNTVTLTTLPNAINTAKQQIAQAKAAVPAMIAALERFENDYNLQDGTDYSRLTMSAKAWTDLLGAVNDVTTALDDISQATNYSGLAAALIAQMDATDASLRLFKSYKAMADGVSSVCSGSTAADSEMDTDASEQAAITAYNTAFTNYALAQDATINMAAFLGENLDFSAAEGAALNTDNSNNIHAVTGWEVNYADADQWAVLQTHQSDNDGKLYMRKNWGSSATTLTATKEKMLPVGKYTLTFSWNSDLANMTNRSQYKLGDTAIAIGENTDGTLTYEFEITGSPQPFDLTFGFQKTGEGNTPAQIVVDDVTLTYTQPTVTLADNAANDAAIANNDGYFCNVKLDGRTLYKDDSWNTLCLPFSMTAEQVTAQLAPSALMELDKDGIVNGHTTGLDGSTLYLNFKTAESIKAGTPYIIKWSNGTNITDPTFRGVTVTDGNAGTVSSTDGNVTFQGTYAPIALAKDDKRNLYIDAGNALSYPATDGFKVNAFRAYFRLSAPNAARSFVLNFGGETTGISLSASQSAVGNRQLFDLQGRPVGPSPLRKGIYISAGKTIIKK